MPITVMNGPDTPSLNLLRYPRRRLGMSWVGWALAGGMAGWLCASGWGLWSQTRLAQEQSLREQLQTRLNAQSRARTEAGHEAGRLRLQQRAQERAAQWQAQRAQLQALHARLAQEERDSGLRLQRWQGDGQRIELQAALPRGQALPALLARLSAEGSGAWTLHSLGSGVGEDVELVLQAPVRKPQSVRGPVQEGRRP